MPHTSEPPRGIRNNNPGNMRRGRIPEIPFQVIDGFARFRTADDGLVNLADWIMAHTSGPAPRTLFDVVSIYAPPSENDTIQYTRILAQWCRVPLGAERTKDIRSFQRWQRLDMMRGIIQIENGNPPSRFSIGGEWFSAPELWGAFDRREIFR